MWIGRKYGPLKTSKPILFFFTAVSILFLGLMSLSIKCMMPNVVNLFDWSLSQLVIGLV